jgi:hypothetical protein
MYKQNPFHNFEHASHVTMSVVLLDNYSPKAKIRPSKRVKQIVAPRPHLWYHVGSIDAVCLCFAASFDVDHPGVPNTQLVKENAISPPRRYEEKSVAEQFGGSGLELCSWTNSFSDLRHLVFHGQEMRRFRQLVVNSVATDIVWTRTSRLSATGRWERPFRKVP